MSVLIDSTMYLCLCRFVEELFGKFKHLFALDPCFILKVYVYICQKKDLFSLFECIPVVWSTAWLAQMALITAPEEVKV